MLRPCMLVMAVTMGLTGVSNAAWAESNVPDDPIERLRTDIASGLPEVGRQLIVGYGCGACHRIPQVSGARGVVGPDLKGFAARSYIAGVLPNTPDNLVRWLQDPPSVNPGTAMPDMGITRQASRHIAAWLYGAE